jgi:hypothetical protein
LRKRNHPASKIDCEFARKHNPDVTSLTPVGLDKLGSELDETKLLRAVPIGLRACARKRRMPVEGVKVDLEWRHELSDAAFDLEDGSVP